MSESAVEPQYYNYTLISFVYAFFLVLSTFGFAWATYILIGIISLLSVIVAISTGVISNTELRTVQMPHRRYKRHLGMQLFSQFIFTLCIYQIYVFGFHFLAGFFFFTAMIGYTGSIMLMFKQKD